MADEKKKKKVKGYKEFDPTKFINTEPVLDEAVQTTAVVSFGRMNPITVGHEKLAMKVMDEARRRKATPLIFLSHSQDAKKNPLSYDDKVMFAKRAFGAIVKESPAKTIIDVAKSLTGKFKKLVVVVGSDRVAEFETLLNKYNGKDYKFDFIDVVSAGGRDPDAEGVAGMSASKMREFAANNDMKSFSSGLPKNLKSMAKEVMAAVRKGMNMSEETDLELEEALNRVQRRKRAIAMRRARFKIRRGKLKAERKAATLAVLKKRARKAALKILKNKFAKGRNYNDLSSAEKEVIDKRIEKISPKRIEAIARKLLKKVKQTDIDRRKSMSAGPKKEDLDVRFENFLSEASCTDTKVRKKPHMLLNKEGQVKFDGRFKLYKKKVNESTEDLSEEITDLMESTEAFVEAKDTHKTKDGRTAKKGLWYNIHQKRKRGEKPAKPGDKDYPKTLDIDESELDELSLSVKDLTKPGTSNVKKAMKADDLKKELAAMRKRLKKEEHGAGDEGTDKLVKRYKKDTPNCKK